MPALEVRRITADQTHALRNRVLRPGQPASACRWEKDEDSDSFHAGIFLDGILVAIATVIPEMMPETDPSEPEPSRSFRLRGMATDPQYRGQGCGAALLSYCIEHTRSAGGDLLWCNARTPAVTLYQRAGFETLGEEFEVPLIGPHMRMRLVL